MDAALHEIRLENAAAYMAADLESDRAVIEQIYDAAYGYVTGGVCPDPAQSAEGFVPGLFDTAVNCLALHWYDHRSDMEGAAFPAALRPMFSQLKALYGSLVG